jgi:ribosomal protein S18
LLIIIVIIIQDLLDHLDILTLKRFVSDDSEILGRKHTGLCARCQRKVAKTIKKSRNFGIMPHLGEFIIKDAVPVKRDQLVHDAVQNNNHVISKTIL